MFAFKKMKGPSLLRFLAYDADTNEETTVLEKAYFIMFTDDGGTDNVKYSNAYWLRGTHYDVLIDCLSGRYNLYDILLPKKELKVFLTHSHLDHAAGLKHFLGKSNVTVYIGSEEETEIIKQGLDPDNVKQKYFRMNDDVALVPFTGGRVELLQDGQTFSLSDDVTVTALSTPGHSVGSFCFYTGNAFGGTLFTGDTFYPESASMLKKFCMYDWELQKKQIIKLSRLLPLENVWPGHYFSYECKQELLDMAASFESASKKAFESASKKAKTLECMFCSGGAAATTAKQLYYEKHRPHLVFCGRQCQRNYWGNF